MKIFYKALKVLACASLVCSIGLSATACNVNKDPDNSGDTPTVDDGNNGGNGGGNTFVPPDDGSEGIDWTKYWDGVLSTESSADTFKFTGSKEIGSISGDYIPDTGTVNQNEDLTVKFSDGVTEQIIEYGGLAVKPVTPVKDGNMFAGWYTDTNYSTEYDFSKPVETNLNLHAKWVAVNSVINSVNGYNESLAVTWTDGNPANATAEYRLTGESAWKQVDAPLIRKVNGEARVDIVGLKAGKYDVRITPSSGSAIELPAPVAVEAYDRSGYAHFGRKTSEAAYDGVGAYKDDGTLKDGALVIYVNEENKNDLSKFQATYLNTPNGLVYEDISKYYGKDENGTTQKGIGYLLNNAQYSKSDKNVIGIKALTDKYGAVAVRILGTVSAEYPGDGYKSSIGGLTQPNTRVGGGSPDDNGRMVRMTNTKNVTVEGIGEDTVILGWGFHFVANDNLNEYKNAGTSFEARNMAFNRYPEDALGMEGTQGDKVDATGSITSGASSASAKFISPVERCWIHNNVFYQGYFENPKESDKAEGDGSCDFKRGQYYTLSYNYFENCHKTNLLGSSDTSLTYNVSIHHNWYNGVQSRQPLTRRANVHYYNNYVSNASDYVTSFRANCLVFSEANYYDGCKNVTQMKDGVGVALNNIYYSCFSENSYTELTSRTQTVPNNCKFLGYNIDYTQFYINSSQFYYDSTNEVSDCLLDSAVGARYRVMLTAGVHDFGRETTAVNEKTPTQTVSNGSIDLKSVGKGSSTINNVLFNGITSVDKGTVKGKGQIITFALSAPTELQVATTSTGTLAPDLIQSNGKVWASHFTGNLTIVLPAGTYIIATGQKDKESVITNLSFADTQASSKARIQNAKTALAEIPSTITMNSESKITEAQMAYSALLANERAEIPNELYQQYAKAIEAFNQLQVDYVIARINHIGEVNVNSYTSINLAQIAYSNLSADKQSLVTNHSTLVSAWATYDGFAAQNVINKLNDLPDLSQANVKTTETLDKLKDWFGAVNTAFESLSSAEGGGQQAQVQADNNGATYKKLTDGLAEISALDKYFEFKEALKDATTDNASSCGSKLTALYNALPQNLVNKLTAEEMAKYEAIKSAYEEFAKQAVSVTFIDGKPSSELFKHTGAKQGAKNKPFTVNAYSTTEQLASGLKLESSTELTLTLATKMTVSFYFFEYNTTNTVAVDGKAVEMKQVNGDNVATVTLEAGAHKIARANKENAIYYAVLTPAT